ncbi:KCTD1_15 [Mytilus coruscus]|uniref:KCTD1_15 n=1 Tax=Mytilus coruscus TaxID=42192 RepID=A0A6J8DSG9_MYTCO|nr:KCTD1_15 [Mytilus coruscus]
MLNFGRQEQEEPNSLKKSSFGKFTDDKGHTYYKMTYTEANKTHHEVDSHEKSEDINCPVASLDFYLSKLSPKCNALFQQLLLYPKPNCWYTNQATGKNKLSQLMQRISNEAGLSYRYTNHCIKGTGLNRAGVDDLTIISVTDHRNIKSLESYVARPSDAQRRALSSTLQGAATARNGNCNESVS